MKPAVTILLSALMAGVATVCPAAGDYADNSSLPHPPAPPPAAPATPVVVPLPPGLANKGLHFAPGATAPVFYDLAVTPVYDHLDAAMPRDLVRMSATEIQGLTKNLNELAALTLVRAGSYEVRILSFRWQGGLGIGWTLWLKSDDGSGDLFYFAPDSDPYGIQGTQLKANTLYTAKDLFGALRAADQAVRDARLAYSGPDATTRLKALQATLDQAVGTLNRAPASAKGFFAKAIADLVAAQADVAQGLDYIKAHPEANTLVSRAPNATNESDDFGIQWRPDNFQWSNRANGMAGVIPGLPAACDAVSGSLLRFWGVPWEGADSPGELGGNRDAIIRDVAIADTALANAIEGYLTKGARGVPAPVQPPSEAASVTAPADWLTRFFVFLGFSPAKKAPDPFGSISGNVLGSNGRPAIAAVITFRPVDSPNFGKQLSGATLSGALQGALPGTLSDGSGAFVIRNLSPGFYAVGAGSGEWEVVEVKAGADTPLPAPLTLNRRNLGAG